LAYVVEREPDGADLLALHVPVGGVVVPRSGRGGPRLLDEELVVEDVRRGRAHRSGRERACARAKDVLGKLVVAPPEELVVVEAARGALRRGVLVAERAGVGHVGLRRLSQHLDPSGWQHAAKHYSALLGKLLNVRLGHGRERVDARQRAQRRQRAHAAADSQDVFQHASLEKLALLLYLNWFKSISGGE